MVEIMTEQVSYGVDGATDMLDELRQFAIALGWTVDYWEADAEWDTSSPFGWISGTDVNLQLYSPGYGNQNMVYRFRTADRIAGEKVVTVSGIDPGERTHSLITTNPNDQDYFNTTSANYNQYRSFSAPDTTFESLHMFGTDKFINIILKVTSASVISFCFGTPDLFDSWQGYSNGLNFVLPACYNNGSSQGIWSKMLDYPSLWYGGWGLQSGSVRVGWYEDASQLYTSMWAANYRPEANEDSGAEAGSFNKMNGVLNYNAYTDKRVAFQGTYFIIDPIESVWYPLGLTPCAFVNGQNLEIGDTVFFGTDEYRCFPLAFSAFNVWQAYRVA